MLYENVKQYENVKYQLQNQLETFCQNQHTGTGEALGRVWKRNRDLKGDWSNQSKATGKS